MEQTRAPSHCEKFAVRRTTKQSHRCSHRSPRGETPRCRTAGNVECGGLTLRLMRTSDRHGLIASHPLITLVAWRRVRRRHHAAAFPSPPYGGSRRLPPKSRPTLSPTVRDEANVMAEEPAGEKAWPNCSACARSAQSAKMAVAPPEPLSRPNTTGRLLVYGLLHSQECYTVIVAVAGSLNGAALIRPSKH